MREWMVRYKNSICIIFMWLICIFLLHACYRNIEITVTYYNESQEHLEGLTTLYYNNGNGFSEEYGIYKNIENDAATYSFSSFLPIKKIRIQPTRNREQIANLETVQIKVNGEDKIVLSGHQLYEALSWEAAYADVTMDREQVIVSYGEQNWCYVDLKNSYCDQINTFEISQVWKLLLIVGVYVIPLVLMYITQYLEKYKWYTKLQKAGKNISLLFSLLLLWFFQEHLSVVWIFVLWLFPFLFGNLQNTKQKTKIRFMMDMLAIVFSVVFMVCSQDILWSIRTEYTWKIDYVFLILCGWVGSYALSDLVFTNEHNPKISSKWYMFDGHQLIEAFAGVSFTFLIYEYIKLAVSYSDWLGTEVLNRVMIRYTLPVYLMNLFWGILFLWTLKSFLGNFLANVVYIPIYLLIVIGNSIKLIYHNTMLTPLDLLQLSEAMKIGETVLGQFAFRLVIVAAVIVVTVLIVVAIYFRKRWIWKLRVHPSWIGGSIGLLICTCFTRNVINEDYLGRDIFYKGYTNEIENEKSDGFVFYNIINLSKLDEIFMDEPAGYNKEYVENIINEIDQTDTKKAEGSPNVILIMAESLFDIENISEVTLNEEIEPTIRKYKAGTLISPRYGGYTSAVEYEALTGLSLAFYPSATVPYTTYFNSTDKSIPSIATEFGKNGYYTCAIHPNDKTFYNRDIAYEILGFDEFLDQDAFTMSKENLVAGTYLKDMPIAEKIVEVIENTQEPVFTFAVTIAGHYMSEDRYTSTDVEASCELLNDSELNDIEQAASAYQETDEMFQYLAEYIESSDEEILLYIFGDHLPPLPAFEKLNYIQDTTHKYSTCLSAYSNFMEIEFPEYITPNQIAAQIMHDSGITHSSYYDYIYNLRESYPVIHKEFGQIDGNSDLDIYRAIQYDIMFGQQYFYQE